jgi:hypothetical protein
MRSGEGAFGHDRKSGRNVSLYNGRRNYFTNASTSYRKV